MTFSFRYRRIFWLFGILLAALRVGGQDDAASRREAIEGMYPIMMQAMEAKNFGRARNICDQAILWEPQNPVHHYNLACIEAQAGGTRLPYAFGALELSVALGFDEPEHMMADPDLAPLRADPRFNELVRKTTNNANAGIALGAITIPAPSSRTSPAPTTPTASHDGSSIVTPVPASFSEGIPTGFYFTTRYWMETRTLEKAAWYFAPGGTVYRNVYQGFSSDELAAQAGEPGRTKLDGHVMEITWPDGKKERSDIEREGNGFIWNRAIFSAVQPYADASEVVGDYEGAEALRVGGDAVALGKRLELRADGTFRWDAVSFTATKPSGQLSESASGAVTGNWRLDGFSLILKDTQGNELRRIAFPYDDELTTQKPDRLFFGGLMFKKR